LDIPDDQLDEAQLKEKRKERMFKGAYEARERARAAKLAEQKLKVGESRRRPGANTNLLGLNRLAPATLRPCRAALQEEQERQDQLLRETNLAAWCAQMRQKRSVSTAAPAE